MSSPKSAASWVPGNAPGNTLKRYDNISGILTNKLNREWVARFSGRHRKFTAIVKSLFMLQEGHCNRMYNREPDGCARAWENVKPAVQVNALSTFDIVGSRLRSSDEMFLLARVEWERIHDKACPPEKTPAVLSFMGTARFEKLNVARDMLLYKQKASPGSESVKRVSQDEAFQVGQKRRKSEAAAGDGVAKTAGDGVAKTAGDGVAENAVDVKVEQLDGHYECMICSESVRGDAEAVQCSECKSNPMHMACVENTIYATTCPQCARSSMVVRRT